MNIAFFLTPKNQVAYLYDDCSIRKGLSILKKSGYSAVPVITREGRYVCTVSEGDFLWYCIEDSDDDSRHMMLRDTERVMVRDIMKQDRNPPARITATLGEVLNMSMNQNFIPVIDDNDSFIGIVTRKDIIKYFSKMTMTAAAAVAPKD